MLGRP
jgi:hypothetical protein